MEEFDVPLDDIKAEIRESVDRLKAMLVESENFIREHRQVPPEADAN